MPCLYELIGVKKACTDIEPITGLYINDLPGMSLKLADAAANSEKVNGIKLIQDRIEFAEKYLSNDIRNFMQDRFVINSILEQTTVGIYKEDNNVIASSNKLRGIKIIVREYPYLNINISRIGLRLSTTVDTNVLIYDLYKNELLYTLPISAVADQITYINVNKKIPTNKQRRSLFICIDANVSDQYDASLYNSSTGCMSCNQSQYLSYPTSGTLDAALSKTESNFVSSNSTGGLTIDYTIECDLDNYICSLGTTLAWPLLYKTGHLIMQELEHSDQLNTIVMIDSGKNKELADYYDAEYIKSLNQITQNIKTPKDICFQCAPKIRKVVQIP